MWFSQRWRVGPAPSCKTPFHHYLIHDWYCFFKRERERWLWHQTKLEKTWQSVNSFWDLCHCCFNENDFYVKVRISAYLSGWVSTWKSLQRLRVVWIPENNQQAFCRDMFSEQRYRCVGGFDLLSDNSAFYSFSYHFAAHFLSGSASVFSAEASDTSNLISPLYTTSSAQFGEGSGTCSS